VFAATVKLLVVAEDPVVADALATELALQTVVADIPAPQVLFEVVLLLSPL
jgi:hypothetical protein